MSEEMEFEVESSGESVEEVKANFDTEADPAPTEEKPAEAPAKAEGAEDDLVEDGAAKADPEKVEAKPDEPDKPEEKPRVDTHDARSRVMQATKRVQEERERADRAEAELARLEKGDTTPEAAPGTPPEPQVGDFATYEEYMGAMIDWKADRKIEAYQAQQKQEAQVTQIANEAVDTVKSFNDRLNAARVADPELMERVDPDILGLYPRFMLTPTQRPGPENDIAEAIVKSEHPAELVLHLSAHPEEMDRLMGLSGPFEVAQAMGRLEMMAGQAAAPALVPPKAPEPTMSKAKPPVTPVSTTASPGTEEVTDDMSLEEHARIYNAEDRRKRQDRSW